VKGRATSVRGRLVPALLPVLLLAALTAACGGIGDPPPDIAYYTLEYDPPVVEADRPLPVVLRVDRFGIDPLYDANRIVYREGRFRRDAYVYHRWWANPAEMVPHFLARDLKSTGLFQGVFVFDRTLPATHVVEGNVDAFYESDGPDGWWAVLSLRISLLAANEPDVTRKVLFQRDYHRREPTDEKSPRALAAAMSRAMARTSQAMVTDIYHRLERAAPGSRGGAAP
jgi:cholesterol transport system auxiliary component